MIKQLSRYSISLIFSLVITWGAGLLLVTHSQFIENPWTIWFYGLINIILAVGFFHLLITPLALLGRKYKITSIIIHALYCSILMLEMLSLFYFSITLNLLGRTIFEFSFDQSLLIMKSFFVFKWYYLLIPAPIIIYFIFNRISFFQNRIVFYILLCSGFISIFIGLQIQPKDSFYKELSENKTIHFIKSIYTSPLARSGNLSEEDITFYQQSTNPLLKDLQYPLYRPTYNTNPLAPFFELKQTPPNIVFIVVESLSASYSGPLADEISYTPFLDSLAQHSLYFSNFLSTAERTFAVLPSILGSLPHGKKGFTNSKTGYPKNKSLPNWLFSNGYTGDFHYGGYARFDYMDLFMNDQGFENIFDQEEYNYEGTGLKTSIDSIPFGIPDKELFESVVRRENTRKSKQPFLDVYLTLSMHYPYMIKNHEQYYERVKKIIRDASVDEQIKTKNEKYIKELATFLYTDDALKWYFKQQKKTAHYDNTIYVIVGDHMMGEIAQNSSIEKFRPILMIYSPLIKEHRLIKGTNSHLDIAPSLYQLLENKYNLAPLNNVSWLGKPFDTSSVFHCDRDVLFMMNDRTTEALLHKNYFLSKDNLYTVGDRLRLTSIEDKEKQEFMKRLLKVSTAIHDDVVTQNILVPPNEDFKVLSNKSEILHINNTIEYENIYTTTLSQSFKKIFFEINMNLSGDWMANDENENNPILVYTLKRGDSTLTWNTVNLELSEEGLEKEKNYSFLISSNLDYKLEPNDVIKVYFWNKAMSDHLYKADIQSLTVKGKL